MLIVKAKPLVVRSTYYYNNKSRFGAGFFLAGLCPSDASQRRYMVSAADGWFEEGPRDAAPG